MKKLVLLFAVISMWLCIYIPICNKRHVPKTTTICVKNSNPTDTVTVYLTLSAGTGWVSNVNGIFGIASTNLSQGCFYLAPNDSVIYVTPDTLALSGNISFGYPPLNCPVGITLYEFTLNNASTVPYAQETVEISCVAGVSSIGRFKLSGGGKWSATTAYPNVTTIQNDSMGKNTGRAGVYPYGCTNCTNTAGMSNCITTPEACDTLNICNVQRNAGKNGGLVKIEFLGLINN